MEQVKALNALEPFLALSKSAASPRAAADLVTRATSSPNTFVFAELLQTPTVAALASSPEYAAHHALLEIFSHGTYETYESQKQSLPPLTDVQSTKLRQLSLLSLARDRTNLSYDGLLAKLGLGSHREVEELLISAIYAGLLEATLDPKRQAVQISSIAPLRDLSPGAVPDMISILSLWSGRCTSTLEDLEQQIQRIRAGASEREKESAAAEGRMENVMKEVKELDENKKNDGLQSQHHMLTRRNYPKRAIHLSETPVEAAEGAMDLDEPAQNDERRSSKRKM